MQLSLFAVFIFATLSAAVPTAFHALRVKENVPAPQGWTRLGRSPSDYSIRLRIAIFQQNFTGLENLLYEISDPEHSRYGAHMSKEEVEKFVSPSPISLALVDEWLVSYGIQESSLVRSPAKDWVSVTVSIRLAEQLLGAVSLSFFISDRFDSCLCSRTTTCGSIPAEKLSFAPRAIAFPSAFSIMWS